MLSAYYHDWSQPFESHRAEHCQSKPKYRLAGTHVKNFKIFFCLFSLIFQSLLVSFLQSSHQSTGIYLKCIIMIWSSLLCRTGRHILFQQFSWISEFMGWMAVMVKELEVTMWPWMSLTLQRQNLIFNQSSVVAEKKKEAAWMEIMEVSKSNQTA